MPNTSLLSHNDWPFSQFLAAHKGDEDLALRGYIRQEARREANAKVQRNAVVDAERDDLVAYFDLGPISDIALKCQRMDYSFALIRSPSFRATIEASVLGAARPAESYIAPGGLAA